MENIKKSVKVQGAWDGFGRNQTPTERVVRHRKKLSLAKENIDENE